MAPSFDAMDDATGAETPDSSSLFHSTRITQCGVMPLQCAGVEVSNKLNAPCTVVKVMAQDRPRLLLALAAFFPRSAHNQYINTPPDPVRCHITKWNCEYSQNNYRRN